MDNVFTRLTDACDSIKERIPFVPKVGLVLGSGLGDYADHFTIEGEISYRDITGFPHSTAPGHEGKYVFIHVNGVPVVCMKGRIHYYEGWDMEQVVMPIRLMKMMGADTLFVTNASGGIRHDLQAGDLMLITDQIYSLLPSPLRGPNISELGVRFPDMSHIYAPDLCALAKSCAEKLSIPLKEGVYIQTPGPQYETPAEIRTYGSWGADAVGMSTACEAISANHMGMRIIGISCIANLAAGISPTPLTEEEVLEAGRKVSAVFTRLVSEIIGNL